MPKLLQSNCVCKDYSKSKAGRFFETVYSVPAQETAKHRAKFGWPPVSDVAVEAKMRNSLKFGGVPRTPEPISAVSGPKFTVLWGHVEKILLFNKFFSDCRYMPELQRHSPTKFCDDAQMTWRFLRPVFPASRVQHISDQHSTFALRPHHCGSMIDIQSATSENRRGKKKKYHRIKI